MALSAGTRLGPYEVIAQIGVGGMGEVYRARDTKLDRDVAIKVLPDAFNADAERVARFQREAKTLASLNHPHIAAIYGLEEARSGGSSDPPVTALVMELVEGDDLSQRVARGPIPLDEALPIAKQIAEALEAAHEQGIIHRDLKPANIKVRPDGTVKVLDFGLAKLTQQGEGGRGKGEAALSMSPTVTSPAMMTGAGVLLGTAAYMSPEQAKGREADKRSDIWAFGCVLFEMLTGRRAFDGDDMVDVLGAVARLEPNWEALPSSLPQPVRTLLQGCLVKDRRKRIADMAVAQFVLDHQTGPAGAGSSLGIPPQVARPPLWRRIAIPSTTLLVGAAGAAATVFVLLRPTAQPVTRLAIPASGDALVAVDNNDRSVAVAPDGSMVVYTSASIPMYGGSALPTRLFARALDQLEPRLLAGPGYVREPFFSPDGAWVGFVGPIVNRSLQKVSATGGPPVPIATLDGNPRGATWGPDDAIVYATDNSATGLQRVSASGGPTTTLTHPNAGKGERDHLWPHFLPGGRAVLFTIAPIGTLENAQIAVLDLQDGSQKVVLSGGSDARYVEGGYLVYGVAGTLRAVAFDLDRLDVRGTPVPVLQQVVTTPTFGAANFGVAANGTLTYVSGSLAPGEVSRTLVWIDRQGREEPVGVPPRAYAIPRLSPDGTRIAVDVRGLQNDIWVWDLARKTMTRLTVSEGNEDNPVWTPDGRHVAFQGGVDRMNWQAADGTGAVESLTDGGGVPMSFSPNGTRLLFGQNGDVGMVTLDGTRRTQVLLKSASNERNAEVSPDGHWFAYESDESGRYEVYVRPFPNVDSGKWQVSTDGGTRPLWARDGRQLFYFVAPAALMQVPISPGATFLPGAAQAVIRVPGFYTGNNARTYDVSPDGRRFLVVKEMPQTGAGSAPPMQLNVVLNWTEELKRLVPTK